jgi:hypothetical protein
MNFSTSGDTWTGETGYNVVNNDTGEIVDSMSAGSYGGGLVDVCVADNACYYIVVTDSSVTVTDLAVHGRWITTVPALSQVEVTGVIQIHLIASASDLVATMLERRISLQLRQAMTDLVNTLVALTQRHVTTTKLQQTTTALAYMKV